MLFITENVPSSLRGELTKWMLQLKPGVFIGTLNSLVGEKLWDKITKKQKKGGAIWVKSMNNEQRFKLKISGNTHWTIKDYDGLQLITHPHPIKTTNENQKKKISQKNKTIKRQKKDELISKIAWDIKGTPDNMIIRRAKFNLSENEIIYRYDGTSAYAENPPETLWEDTWMNEINNFAIPLLSSLIKDKNAIKYPFYNKKILSIDIETTDYLLKAYEGFVNIIGIGILNLKHENIENATLKLYQIFNMNRKKVNVPLLLEFIYPYLKDIDICVVFNKNFDIKILQTVIDNFSLKIQLPTEIFDMNQKFFNLKSLEQYLFNKVGIKRSLTDKDSYSIYYKSFKGDTRTGFKKKIEPIGTYNLTDVLTPLYVYIMQNSKIKKINNKNNEENKL